MRSSRLMLAAGALALALPIGLAVGINHGNAADHLDPPARQNMSGGMAVPGNTADIADLYAWHQGTGAAAQLVTILTFGGPLAPAAAQRMPCDRDVLYGVHISNDSDPDAEINVYVRFGPTAQGQCGVQVENLPGTSAPLTGPVEGTIQSGSAKVFAGLRDDAFFFDLQGFRETLAMGTLRFSNTRDFFAGKNTPAIVLEMPLAAASAGSSNLRIWATTSRIGS